MKPTPDRRSGSTVVPSDRLGAPHAPRGPGCSCLAGRVERRSVAPSRSSGLRWYRKGALSDAAAPAHGARSSLAVVWRVVLDRVRALPRPLDALWLSWSGPSSRRSGAPSARAWLRGSTAGVAAHSRGWGVRVDRVCGSTGSAGRAGERVDRGRRGTGRQEARLTGAPAGGAGPGTTPVRTGVSLPSAGRGQPADARAGRGRRRRNPHPDRATGAYGARASRDTRCPPRYERQRVSSEEGVPRGSARGGSPGGTLPLGRAGAGDRAAAGLEARLRPNRRGLRVVCLPRCGSPAGAIPVVYLVAERAHL